MKNITKIKPFLAFFLAFIISSILFSLFLAKIIYAAEDIPSKVPAECFTDLKNPSDDCLEKFKEDCMGQHGSEVTAPSSPLVIPRCDQTPKWELPYQTEGNKLGFDEYCNLKRPCQLNDFIQLFVDLAKWGWWILPSLALLFLFIGGFLFINSAGNPQSIEKAKKIITSTVIGTLFVVLLAWLLTTFVITILTGGKTIFGKDWWGGGSKTTPGEGCCITELGCLEQKTTKDECDTYPHSSWMKGWGCESITDCQNMADGCCIDESSNICQVPEKLYGCIKYGAAYKLIKGQSCSSLPQCKVGCCKLPSGNCIDATQEQCKNVHKGQFNWSLRCNAYKDIDVATGCPK